jgi:putative transposase
VEAEVTEFLGRARYQRAANTEDARPGARNGYCPTTIKTTAGPVTIDRPKLRGTPERFASRLFGAGVTTGLRRSRVMSGSSEADPEGGERADRVAGVVA